MEKILGGPSLFYSARLTTSRCKRLQKPHAHNYALDEFSLRNAQLSASFENLEIFLYTGIPD